MDELSKGLGISIRGETARQALAAMARQLEQWQLAMPAVEPLVLDFGLGDFARVGLIEYWIANEGEAGYCGKFLFVFDAQTCPLHHHDEKMETFFIVKGRVGMTCGGEDRVMSAGDVLPVPPGTPHGFTGQGPALLLEVSTPCRIDDNCFHDVRIPVGSRATSWVPPVPQSPLSLD